MGASRGPSNTSSRRNMQHWLHDEIADTHTIAVWPPCLFAREIIKGKQDPQSRRVSRREVEDLYTNNQEMVVVDIEREKGKKGSMHAFVLSLPVPS